MQGHAERSKECNRENQFKKETHDELTDNNFKLYTHSIILQMLSCLSFLNIMCPHVGGMNSGQNKLVDSSSRINSGSIWKYDNISTDARRIFSIQSIFMFPSKLIGACRQDIILPIASKGSEIDVS